MANVNHLLTILILCLTFKVSAQSFPTPVVKRAHTNLLICSWQPVIGANAYRVIFTNTVGSCVTNNYNVFTFTGSYLFVRTNTATVFCLVQVWLPEFNEWMDYPLVQWPAPPKVIDHLHLYGEVDGLVIGKSLTGNTNDYTGPIGFMTTNGLDVIPSANCAFYIFADYTTKIAKQGPTQPLNIITIYK